MENYSRFQNSIEELREQVKQDRKSSKLYSIVAPVAFVGAPLAGAVTGYFLGGPRGAIVGVICGFFTGLMAGGVSNDEAQQSNNRVSEHIGKISELEREGKNPLND